MESFLSKVIESEKKLRIIEASKDIPLLNENPHVWLSLTNEIKQIENIAKGLSDLFPEAKDKIKNNAANYTQKIKTLQKEMKNEIASLKTRSFITFHEAFPYFAKEFDLQISDVIEREPGTEPNARELADTITKLNKSSSKIIFVEPQYSQKSAETIAKATGAKIYSLDPLVTGKLNKDAYLEGMRQNLKVLKEALK